MGTSLADFAKRMYTRADRLDFTHNERIKVAAMQGLRYLVTATPVDTSEALSNWFVTIGDKQMRLPIPPFVPGKAGSTQNASIAEALSVGYKIIDSKKPGQSIWLSNVVPYIRKLDQGSSTQAPAGWVAGVKLVIRRSLQAGSGDVRRTH